MHFIEVATHNRFEFTGEQWQVECLPVACLQYIAVGISYHYIYIAVSVSGLIYFPFVAAVGANIVVAVRVGVLQGALGTGWDSGHDSAHS